MPATPRYNTLLRQFAAGQADGSARLRALVASNRAEAERAAHSLKGSAGNLGARPLAAAAAGLEAALRAGAPAEALAPLLAALDQALMDTLDAIAPAPPPAPPPATAKPALAPEDRVHLNRLATLLADSDSDALDLADTVRPALAACLGEGLAGFERALANFDFDLAGRILADATAGAAT